MSHTPKISAKKVLRFTVGLSLLCLLVVTLIAAGHRQQNGLLQGINMERVSRKTQLAISQQELMAQLHNLPGLDLGKTPIGQLDLRSLEDHIATNPWVKDAEVYIDAHNVLQIRVAQRQPVARIFEVTGRSFYVDSASVLLPIPLSAPYAVPVFTSVPLLSSDSVVRKVLLRQISATGAAILANDFWNAQITQIDIADNNEMTAYTLAGSQQILLGTGTNIEEQLNNLLLFFKKVNANIGWAHYTKLDSRFAGQILASPAIGYTPPIVKDTVVQLPDNEDAVHQPAQAAVAPHAAATKGAVSTTKKSIRPTPVTKSGATGRAPAKGKNVLASAPNAKPKKPPEPKKETPKKEERKAKYEMSSNNKK